METRIIIDWISNTNHEDYKSIGLYVIPQLRELAEWESKESAINGYDRVQKHFTGALRMFSSTQKHMGYHTVYSGKVLKLLWDRMGVPAIDALKYHYQIGANTSRLDIAIDVFNSDLSIDKLGEQFDNKQCLTATKAGLMVKNVPRGTGQTLYIGSLKSRKKLMRIYDKGKETGEHPNWVRIEYEVHGKPATQASDILSNSSDYKQDIKRIIRGYCDFITDKTWLSIMEGIHPTKLMGSSSQESDTQTWLLDVVAGSLAKQVALDPEFASKWNDRVEIEAKKYGVFDV